MSKAWKNYKILKTMIVHSLKYYECIDIVLHVDFICADQIENWVIALHSGSNSN